MNVSGVYSLGEWSGFLECYLGNGFDSMIFQGLPSLCFPWRSEIICIQSICCIWKWKQACWTCSVLECFCDFSDDSKSFSSEWNSGKACDCFYSICIPSAVSVKCRLIDSQTLGGQLVTTGFVTHWLEKNELEGRTKTCKEVILGSQQNKELPIPSLGFLQTFFFINQTITATNDFFTTRMLPKC